MTTDTTCDVHGTENRRLVFSSLTCGVDVYECDECQADLASAVNRGMGSNLQTRTPS